MEYQECLSQLRNRVEEEILNGFEIHIKPIPETDQAGVPDPRVLKWYQQPIPPFSVCDTDHITMEEVGILRARMGCENQDLSSGVKTEQKILKLQSGNVPVWIYTPDRAQKKPCVCYFHGGAFYGGTTRVVENACRLLADRANAVVMSVDYALAPENRFPIGLRQCWQAVQWAQEHAVELEILPEKIAVAGDSAGGNIAAACCILDTKHIIKLQLLLYPVFLINPAIHFGWSKDFYSMTTETDVLQKMVTEIKDAMKNIYTLYPGKPEDLFNVLMSPFLINDCRIFPRTFIASSEFDYLRQEEELFGMRLAAAGIPLHFFRYKGMSHAFFEHTGVFPQAEDCTEEMAKEIAAM